MWFQRDRQSKSIRSVTITPSLDQSNAMSPPRPLDTARATILLPKPDRAEGATTGGPPLSAQIMLTSFSPAWVVADTSSVPCGAESAPYFTELVANSCTIKASDVIACSAARRWLRSHETWEGNLESPKVSGANFLL